MHTLSPRFSRGDKIGKDHKKAAVAGAMALMVGFNPAEANLQGATYDYNISGTTLTSGAGSGTATDPVNPAFCVGPNSDDCSTSGLFGSFLFGDSGPTAATITFSFFGGTSNNAAPFTIDLSNFVTTDGAQIIGVSYASGGLANGTFTGSWNGTDAIFNGSTADFYTADGTIVFDVSLTPAPEPVSIALLGVGLVGLYATRRQRRG